MKIHPVALPPSSYVGVDCNLGLVLAKTDAVFLTAQSFVAYPSGFSFQVEVRVNPGHTIDLSGLQIGLAYGETEYGVKIDEPHAHMENEVGIAMLAHPHAEILASDDVRFACISLWVWPLPPPGPVELWCSWPDQRIMKDEAAFDSTILHDLARDAQRLWG